MVQNFLHNVLNLTSADRHAKFPHENLKTSCLMGKERKCRLKDTASLIRPNQILKSDTTTRFSVRGDCEIFSLATDNIFPSVITYFAGWHSYNRKNIIT